MRILIAFSISFFTTLFILSFSIYYNPVEAVSTGLEITNKHKEILKKSTWTEEDMKYVRQQSAMISKNLIDKGNSLSIEKERTISIKTILFSFSTWLVVVFVTFHFNYLPTNLTKTAFIIGGFGLLVDTELLPLFVSMLVSFFIVQIFKIGRINGSDSVDL